MKVFFRHALHDGRLVVNGEDQPRMWPNLRGGRMREYQYHVANRLGCESLYRAFFGGARRGPRR